MKQNNFAVLGGGCFWCTEAIFSNLRGVLSVTPGYAGGTVRHPTYEQVCRGTTGHAEVIRVVYDPGIIRYEDLLDVFFHMHDPTTKNKQGNDTGPQYQSIIFFADILQRKTAEQYLIDLKKSGEFNKPIVTELKPLGTFYEAEEYHKQYYKRYQFEPYCEVVISPKLKALREKFSTLTR
jgi:peptide-methionine (S)-S-oxide reductase